MNDDVDENRLEEAVAAAQVEIENDDEFDPDEEENSVYCVCFPW